MANNFTNINEYLNCEYNAKMHMLSYEIILLKKLLKEDG